MLAIERRLLTQWSGEKAASGPSMNQVGEFLQGMSFHSSFFFFLLLYFIFVYLSCPEHWVTITDPRSVILESPISANVWKVLVQDDDALETGQIVINLEAMKMEISIRVDARFDQRSVRKVLGQPGDTIEGGSPLLIGIKEDKLEEMME